jgi:hypothetical protein
MTLTACSASDRGNGIGLTTRDSLGVEIAEIAGDPRNAPVWATLDTANAFRIAPDESRDETLFARLRGALRMSDGRIAVLDIGRYQVLLFAPDGSFVRSLGRRGQGPGELAQPWRLIRAPGDSIGVYDFAGHLQLFSTSSHGGRRVRLPWGNVASTQILGPFEDGGYLAIMNEFPGEPRAGRNPLFSSLHVMTAAGDSGPALGRHQSTQFTFREGGDGRLRQVETLFWAEPGMAVLPTGYVWCLSTEFDCQIWSNTGTHVRTIRASVATPAVSNEDVERFAASRLSAARTAADTTRFRAELAEADRMERHPVLGLIRTDARGRIWMREYVWRLSDREARWLVFEPDGRVLGTVVTPTDLQVFDIGDDYILGTDRDEDDEERLVMYKWRVLP